MFPIVVFFDFVTNYFLLKIFGDNLSNLLTQGFSSAWPFLIFAAVIVLFLLISKNGKRFGGFLEGIWSRFGGKSKRERNVADELLY